MLSLTDNAVMVIRNLTDQPDVPDGAGLRIASDPSANALTLAMAAQPAQDDQVVDEAGARIFLDPEAAEILDDKALDAVVDAQGAVQFGFDEQSA